MSQTIRVQTDDALITVTRGVGIQRTAIKITELPLVPIKHVAWASLNERDRQALYEALAPASPAPTTDEGSERE